MTDNFNMKQFLMENKLGAYSRLKEATNFSEPWKYEFVKDGDDCIKIDPETGTRSKVHHSYCKRTQNEMETEVEETINESEITYEYGSDGGCYRVDDEGNYDEVDDSYCRRYAGQGVREDIGGDIGDAQAEKMMDFLAEKDKVKEALSPEAFERMDAIASNTAQIAMIKAAEIMMNQLTEEGFEVLDIREYFTQLIANDI
jgi:hypothetical protein